MPSEIDELYLVNVKQIRRSILRILNTCGLIGANEKTVLMVLNDSGFPVLFNELRRHFDYLEQRGVLKIVDRDKSSWAVIITPDGTDIIDGVKKAPDWIAKS